MEHATSTSTVVLGLLVLAAMFGLHALARYTRTAPQHHTTVQRPPPTPRTKHAFLPILINTTDNPRLRLPRRENRAHYALIPININNIAADANFDVFFPNTDVILIRQDKLFCTETPSAVEIPRDRLEKAWDSGWLNDIIVDNFLEVLVRESNTTAPAGAAQRQSNPANKTLHLSSYFIPNDPLITGDSLNNKISNITTALRKQFPQDQHRPTLYNLDTILIPVCNGLHWQLVVVRPNDKKIKFYNSANGRRNGDNRNNPNRPLGVPELRQLDLSILQTDSPDVPTGFQVTQLKWARFIDNLLQRMSSQDNQPWYKHEEWVVCFSRCPQQRDNNSCGVYTALNAELVIGDYPDDWLQQNQHIPNLMNAYRKRICLAILNGNL